MKLIPDYLSLIPASSYRAGLIAEWRARMYLRIRGFKIVKSRYITGRNTGRAEIDIIAKRRNLVIFVEVKKRKCITDAFDAITTPQTLRLRRAAENWIVQNNWNGDARFDIIAVCGRKIHWIKNSI